MIAGDRVATPPSPPATDPRPQNKKTRPKRRTPKTPKRRQEKFDWRSGGVADDKPLLSYGPCQFPTLGLIVQRAWEVQSHVAEPFWAVHASLRLPPPNAAGCDFTWRRGRLFDRDAAAALYEAVAEAPLATVSDVRGAQRLRHAPSRLSTVEMQKRGSRRLPAVEVRQMLIRNDFRSLILAHSSCQMLPKRREPYSASLVTTQELSLMKSLQQ